MKIIPKCIFFCVRHRRDFKIVEIGATGTAMPQWLEFFLGGGGYRCTRVNGPRPHMSSFFLSFFLFCQVDSAAVASSFNWGYSNAASQSI